MLNYFYLKIFKSLVILFRMSKIQNEPLLADNPDRFVMFPLQDQSIWKMYKKMMREIDLLHPVYFFLWYGNVFDGGSIKAN